MLNQTRVITATEELSKLTRAYLLAKSEAKAADERLNEMKGILKALLEPSLDENTPAVDLVDGDVRVTLKAVTSRRLDTNKIKTELPEVYAAYSKESLTYQLTDGLS